MSSNLAKKPHVVENIQFELGELRGKLQVRELPIRNPEKGK